MNVGVGTNSTCGQFISECFNIMMTSVSLSNLVTARHEIMNIQITGHPVNERPKSS